MDTQWIGVALAAITVTVSLAAFIHSGLTRLREEIHAVGQEVRILAAKAADTAERTAHIEGILARHFEPRLQAAVAQGLPDA